jgi:hypothetical protein
MKNGAVARSERRCAPSEPAPGDGAQADHDLRTHQGELGCEMATAVGDLARAWIAVAAAGVARVASNHVGDEEAPQTGACDHPTQQYSRTIAAERDSGAVGAETAGRQPHERNPRRRLALARHDLRAAFHQCRATHA